MAEETKELDLEEVEDAPKSKMMLFIIIGVVVLAAGGGAAFFLLAGDTPAEVAEADLVETPQPAIYIPPTPPFVGTSPTCTRLRLSPLPPSFLTLLYRSPVAS